MPWQHRKANISSGNPGRQLVWDDCSTIRVCRKNLKKIVVICFIIVLKMFLWTFLWPQQAGIQRGRGEMGRRVDWAFTSCWTKTYNLIIYFIISPAATSEVRGGGTIPFLHLSQRFYKLQNNNYNSYSSRTRWIWADIYNQRGRRPSWLLSAHIRKVREE